MEFIKKHYIGICLGSVGTLIMVVLLESLFYCLSNGWGYYYFDVIAKFSPAFAGLLAYYIWSKNREKEIKELEYRNDYYKKIIDKRMTACEKINNMLFLINQVQIFKDDIGYKMLHDLFANTEIFNKVQSAIEDVYLNNMWLSEDGNKHLREISRFLTTINDYLNGKSQSEFIEWLCENHLDGEIRSMKPRVEAAIIVTKQKKQETFLTENNKKSVIIGLVCFEVLAKMVMGFRNCIYKEMKSLHKIEPFLEDGEHQTRIEVE